MSKEEVAALNKMETFEDEELGYVKIQSTRPQTLGYALADSPAGLAAWMLEKFRSWSDCNVRPIHHTINLYQGNIESKFQKGTWPTE